jgi:hypothetical protein
MESARKETGTRVQGQNVKMVLAIFFSQLYLACVFSREDEAIWPIYQVSLPKKYTERNLNSTLSNLMLKSSLPE